MELGIGGLGHATEIGAGASAVVYKAIQVDLDREVAVKVLSANDDAFVRRFRREARTLGKLSLNPGIVTVHGTGVTDSGQPYLILELCEASVLDHLKAHGTFDPESACRVAAEVADAVSDAHSNGVVHRDIKPANLLRSQHGRYLITDFGISTVRDSTLGQTESIGFTVGYAAPETLRGDEAGTPADVYALGATLFHMLAGHPPFVDPSGNSNLMAFAQRVINDPTPDLRSIGIPDDISRIVEGAMTKNPGDRPSAAQLRDQLLAVLDHGGASVVVPTGENGTDATVVDIAPPSNPVANAASTAAHQAPAPPAMPEQPAPDQTAAMVDIGSAQTGAGSQANGPTPPQANQERPTKRLLADATGEAIPPGRADYPLPPHSDARPPWKILLLGILVGTVVLLAGLAVIISQSNDGGVDTVDALPESPQDAEDDATEDDDAEDGAPGETASTEDPASDAPGTAEISDVTGRTEEAATNQLIDDGFEVRVEERTSDDDPPGTVLTQSPTGGTDADVGSVVTIFVAATREVVLVEIPTIVGLTEAEAASELRALGFTIADPKLEFSESPDGQVIDSEPRQGSSVDSTSSVTLILSKGLEPPECASLVGLTEAAATDIVEAADLQASSVRMEDDSEPDGQVTACTISDDTFNLVVSDGPEICGAVTGSTLAEGTAALEAKDYTVEATEVVRPDLDAGEIFACTKQGRTANISYAGALPSECPAAATGATASAARRALQAAGFADITLERADSDTVPDGNVINCEVTGAAVVLTVSSGPAIETGTLTVKLDSLTVGADCAGDGLRPDLYGSLALSYDGETKSVWTNRLASEAKTPNDAGQLSFSPTRGWPDVPTGGELVITWDLKDKDNAGRAGDEDGRDDDVSAGSRTIELTGAPRTWRPSTTATSPCEIGFDIEIAWAGLDS